MTALVDSPPSTTTPTRGLAALVVVAAPLLVLAGELIAPREPSGMSDAANIAFLRDNSGRLTASWLVGMLAAAALATAYVLIAGRLHGRGRMIGSIAAVLGVLGAIGLAGHYAVSMGSLDLALSDPGLGAAVESLESGRIALATIPPVVLGLNLAILLISIAAARVGWVPNWAILLGVGALIGDFSPTNYNTVIHACFATALFVMIVRGWDREPVGQVR